MSEQDKKIKHFIFMKFFSWQNPNYPYDVLDVDFLSKQLPIAKNALRSLENQTNKNFELIFIMNSKVFDDKKYEFIFSTLKNFTTIPIKFTRLIRERRSLIEDALNKYDFVIQSRMDLDDFIFKDAVEDIQNKVNDCYSILAYGYCKGYVYIFDELYSYYNTFRGIGHINILESLILKSSTVRKMFRKCLRITSFHHHIFKTDMKKVFEKNNVEFSESMFQQNTSTNAFIYFRHEFSQEKLTKNKWKVPKRKPLTTEDITKKQLEEEFGFVGYELKSIT